MRPDEHKKKKNSQYKKKHGITDKDTTSQNHLQHKGPKQRSEKQSDLKQDGRQDKQKNAKEKTNISHSTDSSASSDEEIVNNPLKSFQRRKVVSNWDRYDLPPDEEPVKPKGENFSKLLQTAGGSSSQFRFKEEAEEWTSSDQAELSLDLQDLSACMSCVPLYKVLRLNKDLFTAEQIAEYDRKSSEYQMKQGKLEKSSSSDKHNPKKDNLSVKNLCDELTSGLAIDTNDLDKLLDSVVSDEKKSEEAKSFTESVVSKVDNSGQDRSLSTLEDDLDDLLEGKLLQTQPVVKPEKTVLPSTKDSQDNELEDWLDSVLDG